VNHNKWEELKVEEIRTDNTETLKNALERIKELEKENTELKERHTEILEAFASASSGDDFEMAESAREIMEILNIPCYRHGKVVSKLTKAKEIIKKFSEFVNNEAENDPEYPEYSQEQEDLWNELCEQAEQFLKEESE
jgi:cysteinyl-tRNA synthetase